MTRVNDPVVRALWANHKNVDRQQGLTGFGFSKSETAEERFVDELDNIDLHHGTYSSTTPYTRIEVIVLLEPPLSQRRS